MDSLHEGQSPKSSGRQHSPPAGGPPRALGSGHGLSQEKDTLLASQAPEDFADLTSTFDLSAAKTWMNESPLMSSKDRGTL